MCRRPTSRLCLRRGPLPPGYDVGVDERTVMMKRIAVALTMMLMPVGAELARPVSVAAQATTHAECSHLTMIRFPDVKIASAAAVAEGASTDPACAGAGTPNRVRARHCPVRGSDSTESSFPL